MLRSKLLYSLQGRCYGAAAVAPSHTALPTVSPQSLKVQQSPAGLAVASEDSLEPVSRLVAVVQAGARCEGPGQKGVTHALRRVASLSSTGSSQFMLEKKIQQLGANLCVTGTREHVIYSIEVLRDRVKAAGELLGSVITGPVFKSWELDGPTNMIAMDRAIASQDPFMEVVEMLHKAAFRDGGLGNRLFSPDDFKLDADQLEAYVHGNFSPERMSLYGQGVGEEEMVDVAGTFAALPGGQAQEPSPFKGGELRKREGQQHFTVAVVAGEGPSTSGSEACVYGVLEQLLGCGPSVKWGQGQGQLNAAVGKATGDAATASCFNAAYSDSGLFGVQLVGEPGSIGKAVEGAFGAIKTIGGGVQKDALEGAKARLKAAISFTAESSKETTLARATRLIGGGGVGPTLAEVCRDVDAVTAQQVQQAAGKLSTGKLAMASVGQLDNTPYLDEIRR